MRIDVFTLFPEWFEWFLGQRHVRNALEGGSEFRFFNYRDTTPLSGGQVDDSPYGGGAGMVLRVDVVDAALEAAYGDDRAGQRVVLLTPSGRQLDEPLAAKLAAEPRLTLLCGRYEGVDERVRERLADDAVSVGPYVLSGGELAAMVVADAVVRKLPGALGHADSAVEESFSDALEGGPEYPHYTRPATYRGWEVPEILLSGHHERVHEWRLGESRSRAKPRSNVESTPQSNVEIVRALAEAFQRRDHERAFDFYDPQIEWDASRMVIPDVAGVYRGHEGVRTYWRQWLSAWKDLEFEVQDVRGAGDEVALLVRNQRQWGRHSGIATEVPPYGMVFTIRGGKVVRWRAYPDQEAALEAAGLGD